jgi:glucose/arabinose dehydrogenase
MEHLIRPLAASLATLGLAALACGGGGGSAGGGSGAPNNLTLAPAFASLDFAQPVKLVQHPVDDNRWYVVEQGGKIFTFLASNPAGTLTEVLDLVADQGINLGGGVEQGLLGLAFDPDFDNGGELYITYTDEDDDDSILARYESPDVDGPFVPDADDIVLAIPRDASNHNGGDIMFGPDEFLYYSMGDGTESALAQNTSSLLGKVLRIDVLGTPAGGEEYNVPASNPFNTPGRPFCDSGQSPVVPMQPCPEVWAYGLRNPWRMNFDPETDQLYLGDVGEERREEIDLILAGRNYGWPCVEGNLEGPASCGPLISSAPEAVHGRNDAAAITGGAVYRGSEIPDLEDFYVYGDFIEQNFFAFHIDDPRPDRLDLPGKNVSAFGQGRDGEIYVVTFDSPSIYKIVEEGP